MTDAMNRYWNAVNEILKAPAALKEHERAARDQSRAKAESDAKLAEARRVVEGARGEAERIRAGVHDKLAQGSWEGLLGDPSLRSGGSPVKSAAQLNELLRNLRSAADRVAEAVRDSLAQQVAPSTRRSVTPVVLVSACVVLAVAAVGLLIGLVT